MSPDTGAETARRAGKGTALAALALGLCLALPLAAQEAPPGLAALTAQAEAGSAEAQYALGLRHHAGDGTVQNFAEAARWFARAAEAGHPGAQNRLGRYRHAGLGGPRDQAAALRWLRAAAAGGDPAYLHDLAKALENGADGSSDPAAAAALYGQAADKGSVEAAVSLAVLLQEGRGIAPDLPRAAALYEEAAAAGHPRAQNNLGLMLARGLGVPQDHVRAARLFEAAAQQGVRQALTNLAVMYENGFGVPVDEARAARLYARGGGAEATDPLESLVYDPRLAPAAPGAALERAAGAGDPVAQFQLGWLLASAGTPDFAADARAAQLFGAAARAGMGAAMVNLGLLHVAGRGVPQDYRAALSWLTLAGSAGHPAAPDLAATLSARMPPAQIEAAQARAAALWEARRTARP